MDTKQKGRKLRVAAYIRVSTGKEEQEESFLTQETYFSEWIRNNPEWEYCGIYSDYGVSGIRMEERTGFRRMLRHCEDGKIDRILCKSVSRFSRNTADLLEAVRIIRKQKITIYFEKEAIDTAEPVNGFLLTSLAAIAQEESRSVSENVRKGIQMRFAEGEACFQEIYGYRILEVREADGRKIRQIVTDPGEAEVIRYIYKRIEEGTGFAQTARELNEMLIPYTVGRQVKRGRRGQDMLPDCGWNGIRVRQILETERYTGNVLCQKTCKQDFFSGKDVPNCGQFPQYYVENNHPQIITVERYQQMQSLLERRNVRAQSGQMEGSRGRKYLLSGRIVCGCCGRIYHRRLVGDSAVWECPTSKQTVLAENFCVQPKLYEIQIKRAVRKAAAQRYDMLFYFKWAFNSAAAESLIKKVKQSMEQDTGSIQIEQTRAAFRRRIFCVRQKERRKEIECRKMEAILKHSYKNREQKNETIETIRSAEQYERIRQNLKTCRQLLDLYEQERKEEEQKLKKQEDYWKYAEESYNDRRNAMRWMEELEPVYGSIPKLLGGISGAYLRAWVNKITVHSVFSYQIQWFDGQVTTVTLEDNPENKKELDLFLQSGRFW